MKKPLIYVVEDDEGIQEVYLGALENDYEVRLFSCGSEFFDAYDSVRPALVVLDIMLPDMDGYTILTKIREKDDRLPVIIVSAKGDEISFVKGLNKGADDYMSKPFSVLEFLARVRANLRRNEKKVTKSNGFEIDNAMYSVSYQGVKLKLTLKEFNLLKLLLQRSGETVTREEIFSAVWGEDYLGETRTLDIHISQLREKLKAIGGEDVIVTVRGVGYRI